MKEVTTECAFAEFCAQRPAGYAEVKIPSLLVLEWEAIK